MKATPNMSRSGTVAHVDVVDVNLWSITAAPFVVNLEATINPFWVAGLVRRPAIRIRGQPKKGLAYRVESMIYSLVGSVPEK